MNDCEPIQTSSLQDIPKCRRDIIWGYGIGTMYVVSRRKREKNKIRIH